MTLLLPILCIAFVIGLTVRQMTPRVWAVLIFAILLVIGYAFLKPPKLPKPASAEPVLRTAAASVGNPRLSGPVG